MTATPDLLAGECAKALTAKRLVLLLDEGRHEGLCALQPALCPAPSFKRWAPDACLRVQL